eukprot:6403739-Pyramimonas_sp.AAC.1
MIDRAAKPPKARHLQATFPDGVRQGPGGPAAGKTGGIAVINPADALQHLPQVEPLAAGTVFNNYSDEGMVGPLGIGERLDVGEGP